MISDDAKKNPHPAIYHHLSNGFCGLARTEIRGRRIISTTSINDQLRSRKDSCFETIIFNSDFTLVDREEHADMFSAKKGHLEMIIKYFYGGMDEYPPNLRIVEC
jgi:hypothetical protein